MSDCLKNDAGLSFSCRQPASQPKANGFDARGSFTCVKEGSSSDSNQHFFELLKVDSFCLAESLNSPRNFRVLCRGVELIDKVVSKKNVETSPREKSRSSGI